MQLRSISSSVLSSSFFQFIKIDKQFLIDFLFPTTSQSSNSVAAHPNLIGWEVRIEEWNSTTGYTLSFKEVVRLTNRSVYGESRIIDPSNLTYYYLDGINLIEELNIGNQGFDAYMFHQNFTGMGYFYVNKNELTTAASYSTAFYLSIGFLDFGISVSNNLQADPTPNFLKIECEADPDQSRFSVVSSGSNSQTTTAFYIGATAEEPLYILGIPCPPVWREGMEEYVIDGSSGGHS